MRVCSTEFVYHYLLNPESTTLGLILDNGLRPLSDFPGSDRWQAVQRAYPGFFKRLYEDWAEPVINKPYANSGVFLTPIDFRLLPESILYAVPRIVIPLSRLDPTWCCLTYEFEGRRISLLLSTTSLEQAATLWTADLVVKWFGVDRMKLFYYVPQVACYQPGGIVVQPEDVDEYGAG